MLTNRQYAFARDLDGVRVIVTVNNDDNAASMDLAAGNAAEYVGTLTGEKVSVENGRIHVTVAGNRRQYLGSGLGICQSISR